jgi:hypothetical protein
VHHALDPIIVGGPWVAAGGVAVRGLKTLRNAMAGDARDGNGNA